MNMRELEAQALSLTPVIAQAIAKALAPLRQQLAEKDEAIAALAKRLDELPSAPEPVDVAAIAKTAAELIIVPEPVPGKDAEPVDLDALAKAASELVKVDLEAVAALVQLPEPIPGKDAEPVDLEALAKAAADLIVVPVPVPGKDAEPVDLDAVAKAAAALVQLPEPIPGKDAEPVDLDAVAKAAANLVVVPEPAAIDLAAVAALVLVPQPEPVDLESIARSAAALVPVPQAVPAEHGRDALDLEILPAIDETKQYPRGTYAAHRGGLWKSYERTHGLRGWECIVDGIDGVTVTQDSVREFSVTLSKSSGVEVVQKFSLPVQVYKGVYREGDRYDENDTTTWAGSVWACNKDATTDKPGTSDDWTLVVKAGRPGKDLRENASTFDPSKGVKL